MAGKVWSAIHRARELASERICNDEEAREADAERDAALAELRELEDCKLILLALGSRSGPVEGIKALARYKLPLTDPQRAALVKACGETAD